MPLSTTRPMMNRSRAAGFFSSPPFKPPWSRSSVLRRRLVPSRSQSHGFSLCSRTYFLNMLVTKNSMDSKPARSICSAISTMAAVLMLSAHRLWLPSRNVVSTNRMSLMTSPER